MKITCEACAAKYSIADERIVGRTVKLRCKRCSEVLLVRGPVHVRGPAHEAGEASALFSLENLQALARTDSRPPAQGQLDASEQSGLVDIRALAQLAKAPQPKAARERALIPASPSVNTLSGPALAPVAMESPTPGRRGLLLGGGLVASVALGLIFAIVHVTNRAPLARAGAPEPSPEVATSQPMVDVAPEPAPTIQEPTAPAAPAPEELAPEELAPTPAPRAATRHDRRARESERATPERPRESAPTAPHRSDTPSPDPLETLIRQAVGETPTTESPRAQDADLRETPARQDVERTLRAFSRRVRSCGEGQRGTATVNFTFRGRDGHLQRARVSGAFAGTPVADCVQRAVEGARLTPFARRSFNVRFPFAV